MLEKLKLRRHVFELIKWDLSLSFRAGGVIDRSEKVKVDLLADANRVFDTGLDVLDGSPVKVLCIELLLEQTAELTILQDF